MPNRPGPVRPRQSQPTPADVRETTQRHGAAKVWADDMDAGAEPCSDVTSFLYLKSAFLAMEPAHFLISLARSPLPSSSCFIHPRRICASLVTSCLKK